MVRLIPATVALLAAAVCTVAAARSHVHHHAGDAVGCALGVVIWLYVYWTEIKKLEEKP